MDKKSFWRLRHGSCRMPSLAKLGKLAAILGTNRHTVLAVATGLPWRKEMAEPVKRKDTAAQMSLFGRWMGPGMMTPTGPVHLNNMFRTSHS